MDDKACCCPSRPIMASAGVPDGTVPGRPVAVTSRLRVGLRVSLDGGVRNETVRQQAVLPLQLCACRQGPPCWRACLQGTPAPAECGHAERREGSARKVPGWDWRAVLDNTPLSGESPFH